MFPDEQFGSGQLTTEKISGQPGLDHTALEIFWVRSGQCGSKWTSGYSDKFNTQPDLNNNFQIFEVIGTPFHSRTAFVSHSSFYLRSFTCESFRHGLDTSK